MKKDTLITPEFKVSYPKVFKPELNKLNNQMEFSVMALFKKGEDLSALKKAAQEALVEKFGQAKVAELAKAGKLRTPFRDQKDKAYTDEATGKSVMPAGMEEGAIFITLRTKQRPGVVDMSVKTIDALNENEFYGGCFAKASVSVYAYEKGTNYGVNFGLRNIQKTKDGDPLGSRTRPQDDFAPIEGIAGADTTATSTSLFD